MKHLVIVGGGITGLVTALKLCKRYKITIVDAGPDPKDDKHTLGATYSGLDARHISFTETAPWTSSSRHELIVTESAKQGWLCIPKNELNDLEKNWIAEFQKAALDPNGHSSNTTSVVELNKQGINGWENLEKEYDFIKPVSAHNDMPIICRSKTDLIDEFSAESSLDPRCQLYENTELPESISSLNERMKGLGNLGYFTLYGNAFYAKSLCLDLINFLKSQGVIFIWDQPISDTLLFESEGHFADKVDGVAWCSGVSESTSKILSDFGILLAGVIGCWVEIDNPGISVPCKIYGPEPVNYINITPEGGKLLMSGGYGFVGIRTYERAVEYAKPVMNAMCEEVGRWFPESEIRNKAYCVRPATPTGIPTVVTDTLNKMFPIVITVGHSAGGFTQAPNTADLIEKELESVL